MKILEQKLFNNHEIELALQLVADKGKGYKNELIKDFLQKLSLENRNEAERLFLVLELLGYISNGISEEGKETWRATYRAYKEVWPMWKLLFKSLGLLK